MVAHLLAFQALSGDPRAHGGWTFGFHSDGRQARHVNSWCTMFAMQALDLYVQNTARDAPLEPFLLI